MLDPKLISKINSEIVRLREFSNNSSDGSWSGMSQAEIIMDLNIMLQKFGNHSVEKCDIEYFISPTGHMQDFAIDNGWGDQFCEIANHLELLSKGLN